MNLDGFGDFDGPLFFPRVPSASEKFQFIQYFGLSPYTCQTNDILISLSFVFWAN